MRPTGRSAATRALAKLGSSSSANVFWVTRWCGMATSSRRSTHAQNGPATTIAGMPTRMPSTSTSPRFAEKMPITATGPG